MRRLSRGGRVRLTHVDIQGRARFCRKLGRKRYPSKAVPGVKQPAKVRVSVLIIDEQSNACRWLVCSGADGARQILICHQEDRPCWRMKNLVTSETFHRKSQDAVCRRIQLRIRSFSTELNCRMLTGCRPPGRQRQSPFHLITSMVRCGSPVMEQENFRCSDRDQARTVSCLRVPASTSHDQLG